MEAVRALDLPMFKTAGPPEAGTIPREEEVINEKG